MKVDANAQKKPKKPMNAFFVYRKALRDRIIAKYGTTKSHEISKIAGECWAMEPVHVKNYFRDISFKLHEQAREEKLRVQRRMSAHSQPELESGIDIESPSSSKHIRRASRGSISSLSDLMDSASTLDCASPAASVGEPNSPPKRQRPLSMDSYSMQPRITKSNSLPHITFLPAMDSNVANLYGNVSSDILALTAANEMHLRPMPSYETLSSARSEFSDTPVPCTPEIPNANYSDGSMPMFPTVDMLSARYSDFTVSGNKYAEMPFLPQMQDTPVKLEDFL
jgi:hypothetical protein